MTWFYFLIKKIKLIDYTSEEVVHSYNDLHKDFVRVLTVLPNS